MQEMGKNLTIYTLDQYLDFYYDYKAAIDRDYKRDGIKKLIYDFEAARKILETVLLNKSILVDYDDGEPPKNPPISFDMITDYAKCLAYCGEPSNALKLITIVKKYLKLDNVATKTDGSPAYISTREVKEKMWARICLICAVCPVEEASDLLKKTIEEMTEAGISIGAELYDKLARDASRCGNYSVAEFCFEKELELLGQSSVEKKRVMAALASLKRSEPISFYSFLESGKKLQSGMIVGVPREKITLGVDHVPEILKSDNPLCYFMILRFGKNDDMETIYAIPLKPVALDYNKRHNKIILRGTRHYILRQGVCTFSNDAINEVWGTTPIENFDDVIGDLYEDIVSLPRDKRPGGALKISAPSASLIDNFIKAETDKRLKNCKVGNWIVIGERPYCVVKVDKLNNECIVEPFKYEGHRIGKNRFRISLSDPNIRGVLVTTIKKNSKVEVPALKSEYGCRFCKCPINRISSRCMIYEEDAQHYWLLNFDSSKSGGTFEVVVLEKSFVDSNAQFTDLDDLFKYFDKYLSQFRKPGIYKSRSRKGPVVSTTGKKS